MYRVCFGTESAYNIDGVACNQSLLWGTSCTERSPTLIYCLKKIMEVIRCARKHCTCCASLALQSARSVSADTSQPQFNLSGFKDYYKGLVTRVSFPSSDLVSILYRSARCCARNMALD